jgi:hypothetical protein
MVKRRKFLIGVGSLVAGSAAAVGTGAVTNSSSERGLKGRVASDKNGYIALEPNTGGAGHHAQFVEYDDNGELTLNFDKAGEDGNGLNPDSVMSFRSAFTITNQNNAGNDLQVYKVWIESPNSRLSFFTNGGSITGEQNAVLIDQDNPNYPGSVPVGVKIDLRNTNLGPGDDLSSLFDEDDEFIIHVERTVV